MEKYTVLTNPVFWTVLLFVLAFLIRWYNDRKKPALENARFIRLFNRIPPPNQISHIPHQYVHFGLKGDPKNIPIVDENDEPINHEKVACNCSANAKIYIEVITLTGPNMVAEGGNPPTSTISTPTGQDPPKKEGMGLNLLCNNQYVTISNILSYSNYLNDHINFSSSNKGDKVKIALIDTGLSRIDKSEMFLSGSTNVCNEFNDADKNGHGTFVYYFTKVGLAKKGIKNYEIHPYNVADENGNLVYSKILCAMVDAAEKGIENINLSFGFYQHLPEFKSFIDLFLKTYPKAKIVCSAGNEEMEISPFSSSSPSTVGGNRTPHPPSYYHSDCSNIYQITALQIAKNKGGATLEVCDFTNFESKINLACQGSFRLRLNNENCLVEGTSFAAPFFTGYFSDLSVGQLLTKITDIQTNSARIMVENNHLLTLPLQCLVSNRF